MPATAVSFSSREAAEAAAAAVFHATARRPFPKRNVQERQGTSMQKK